MLFEVLMLYVFPWGPQGLRQTFSLQGPVLGQIILGANAGDQKIDFILIG